MASFAAALSLGLLTGLLVGLSASTVVASVVSALLAMAAGANEGLECAGRRFFRLATRTLDEIVGSVQQPGTVDDPAGFLRLVQGFSAIIPPHRLAQLRFALNVDEATGATIAVPQSMRIGSEGEFCEAEAAG